MREIKAVEARKRVHRTEKKSEEKSFRWTKKTLMKRIRRAPNWATAAISPIGTKV
jgi:hypothetical protein